MSIKDAWPDRDLQYTPPFYRSSITSNIISTAILAAVFLVFFIIIGLPLVIDTAIGSQYELLPVSTARPPRYGGGGAFDLLRPGGAVAAEPGRIAGGCRPLLVLQWCSLEMRYGDLKRDLLVVLLVQQPSFRLGVTDSGWLVADAAQRLLGNRWFVAAPPLAGLGYVIGRQIYGGWMEDPVLEGPLHGRFEFVEVAIETTKPLTGGDVAWTYRPRSGGRRTSVTTAAAFEPLILVEAPGAPMVALAVRLDPAAHALLLDRDLAALALTDDERDRLLAAIDAEICA